MSARIIQSGMRKGHGFTVITQFGLVQFGQHATQAQIAFEHEIGGTLVGFGDVLLDL